MKDLDKEQDPCQSQINQDPNKNELEDADCSECSQTKKQETVYEKLGGSEQKVKEEIDKVWEEFDEDGNGMLDKVELKKFLKKIQEDNDAQQISLRTFELTFDIFDVDKNGYIDKDEMVDFIKQLSKIGKSKDIFEKLVDRVTRMSIDIDGKQIENHMKDNKHHHHHTKKKSKLIDQFTQKFANVKMGGESEDENETADPMENNKEQFIYNQSLFLFHVDSKLRRLCLEMSESWSDYQVFTKCRSNHLFQLDLQEKLAQDPNGDYPQFVNQPPKKRYLGLNSLFDGVILILIIMSSIVLPMENPYNDPDSPFSHLLKKMNIFFTTCFLFELIVKIIAKGFWSNQLVIQLQTKNLPRIEIEPYIMSGWNKIDCFVVLISCIDVTMYLLNVKSQFAFLKALRALRALRPLRVIRRYENLRIVVNALFSVFGAIQNVIIIGALILLIFAISGVSFFKGRFYRCHGLGENIMDSDDTSVITKEDCLLNGGSWENSNQNFDNVIQAMFSLFIMMTTDDWRNVMYGGIDATEIGYQPKENSNPAFIVFFVLYMIVGSLFVMNLFVGVVIDNFNKIKDKEENGGGFMTFQQKEWMIMMKAGQAQTISRQVKPPDEEYKIPIWDLIHSKKFNDAILYTIVANTIVMASNQYQLHHVFRKIFKVLNMIFSIIFNMEMILKLLALENQYFWFGWNLFDMFIVISADIGIILDILELSKSFSTAVTILRAFRIMRIVRILQNIKCVRVIIQAVFQILPNIGNVMSLFILVLFIYACIGINLFSRIKMRDDLNEKFNFQSFGRSMVSLMKFSTGDDWSAFMFEATIKENCETEPQTYEDLTERGPQGCGTNLAYPYFISFQVIVSMLILNLTVAAVIDGLQQATAEDERLIKQTQVDELMQLWSKFDPSGTKRLTMNQFFFFLAELPEPFQVSNENILEEYQGDPETHLRERFWIYLDTIHACPYEKEGANKRIRKVKMLKMIKKLKIQTCKGTNRYDRTIYVTFSEIYKLLIKRVFSGTYEDFKITNSAINKKINDGWQDGNAKTKKKKPKTKDKNKDKPKVKEKSLIYKVLAVSIIEDAAKLRLKDSVEKKKKAYNQYQEFQKQQTRDQNKAQQEQSQNNITVKQQQLSQKSKNTYTFESPSPSTELIQTMKIGIFEIINSEPQKRQQESPSTPENFKDQIQAPWSEKESNEKTGNKSAQEFPFQSINSHKKTPSKTDQMTQVLEDTFEWQKKTVENAQHVMPIPQDDPGNYSKFLSDSFSAELNDNNIIQNAYFKTELSEANQLESGPLSKQIQKSPKLRKSKASRKNSPTKKKLQKSPSTIQSPKSKASKLKRESVSSKRIKSPSNLYMVKQNKASVFNYQSPLENQRKSSRSKSKSALGFSQDNKPIEFKTMKSQKGKLQKKSTQPFLETFPAILGNKVKKTPTRARSKTPVPKAQDSNRQRSKTPTIKVNKGKNSLKKLKFPTITRNPQVAQNRNAQTLRLETFIPGQSEELKVQSPTNERSTGLGGRLAANSRSTSTRPVRRTSKKKSNKEQKGKQPSQIRTSKRATQYLDVLQNEEAKEGGQLQ